MFSEKLKELRHHHNLSQEELALILGYSRTAISAYELGRNEPSFADLEKIATYFSVTTDYLLGRTDDPTPPSAARSAPPDPFEDLSEESRKELEKFAELLKIRDKAVENHELAEEIRPEHT